MIVPFLMTVLWPMMLLVISSASMIDPSQIVEERTWQLLKRGPGRWVGVVKSGFYSSWLVTGGVGWLRARLAV